MVSVRVYNNKFLMYRNDKYIMFENNITIKCFYTIGFT